MSAESLLMPMFAMVILTFSVMIINLVFRIKAVRRGQISIDYFKTFVDGSPPPKLIQLKNHTENLFQMPILFYGACLAALAANVASSSLAALAWIYVLLRISHTLIHITYNKVEHRLVPFILSNIVILVMWIQIVG
jgi:hypothetical protein